MKLRSLFLSMCAIAALASCSQNDDEIPGGNVSDAPEAKVILKLAGSGDPVTSRAVGIPDNLEQQNVTVSNLTVFIFNQSGLLLTKEYIGIPAAAGANSITTTTDAKKVAVIANTGDLTGQGGAFASVASESALRAVLSDMLVAPDSQTGAVTQVDNNLYMSGINDVGTFVKQADDAMKADVTVQLNFLSARISLTEISFNGGIVTDNVYVKEENLATNPNANFTIKRVYLMNAQRVTRFLPKTDGGSYIEQGEKKFTGGVAWTDPWTGQAPNEFKPNDEYVMESGANRFEAANKKIEKVAHWYTFANTGVADLGNHPTALVVEVLWREVKADATTNPVTDEKISTKYFTVYFGGGDRAELEAGKAYNIKLALNGNFKPTNQGGSGGGGTDQPDKPTVESSVEVTVTTASWTPVIINKEWT